MDKVKKPFYKKWWFILIVLTIVIGGPASLLEEDESIDSNDPVNGEVKEENKQTEEDEQKEKEANKKADEDKAAAKKKEEEKKAKEKESKRDIEVDQMLNTNNLELEVKTVTIEDGTIAIPIWWKQWNMYDEAHLTLVAHPVVEQNGEELKLISGEQSLIAQKKQLTPALANLKYELINEDEPVTVRFLDIREEIRDEVITIELE